MKLRIRPTLLSDLASSYRLAQSSRASSSASTSTSPSTRKPGRPRRPDVPDELREQGIAPEIVLTSTTGSTPTKSYRPAPAWVVHSNGEEPHLRANPWADTYKIDNSEIEEQFDDSPQKALDRGMKMLDQVPDTSELETKQSAEDHGTRRERYRPHSFGLSTSRASSSRGEGRSGRWAEDRAIRQAEEDAQVQHETEGLGERVRNLPTATNRFDRIRSLPTILPSGQSLVEESSMQTQDESGEITPPQWAAPLSRRQESKAEPAIDGHRRTIRFKSTEVVDIKQGHLVYNHGDHVSDQVWYTGSETEISYHSLRDACPCSKCIDPSTRQRYHTSPDAYREIEASSFRKAVPDLSLIRHEETDEGEGLRINWSPEHSVFFPISRLRDIAVPGPALANRLPGRGQRQLWTAKSIVASPHLYVQFQDLIGNSGSEETLYNTLHQLHKYGIVVIKGVPTEKTDNEDCSLREVMSKIGEIRNTFYGETWNVRNVPNSKNVAYTDVNLGLHADLLYFSSPPRFQALHCLRNRVEGGSSYFVDAFHAVYHMLRDNPEYRTPKIDFEYDNDGHYLHFTHPLYTGAHNGFDRLSAAVNWSPPFQGLPRSATRKGGQSASDSYQSLDIFQRALDEPHREWEFTMEEGDLVLFDNRRVLHARRAFRDLTEAEREEKGVEIIEGESSRWLKGCYLDGEVVWDKLAVLHRQLHGSR